MKRTLILLCLLAFPFLQPLAEDGLNLRFSGFIRNDIFFDSRQTVASREGYFNFFPRPVVLDVEEDDVNDQSRLTMLAISSRMTASVSGLEFLGAKASAVLEADFFGHSETDINGFRLRLAYTKLNWEKTELLIGQYWNSMFLNECMPGTVSFNSGAPFHPFARNPQVRLTYRTNGFGLMLAALSQRDYVSHGPNGPSADYLRNSGLPEIQTQFTYKHLKSGNGTEVLIGIGGSVKKIVPRLYLEIGWPSVFFKLDEKLVSKAFHSFVRLKLAGNSFHSQFVWGENLHDVLMLGGYSPKQNPPTPPSSISGLYSPIRTASFWISWQLEKYNLQPGLFAGYTSNLGSEDRLRYPDDGQFYYSRGSNIDHVWRVSPRIVYHTGKIRLGSELEHTVAAYGNAWDDYGKVLNTTDASNTRFLVTLTYFF
jgi:hypothetical protein